MPTPESYVLKAVMEYLAFKRIWHCRMNTGAVKTGNRFIRYGTPGMADILATPKLTCYYATGMEMKNCGAQYPVMLWLECKAPKGKQSPAQLAFQREVEAQGHFYLLVRSIDDVEDWLKANC
jgi:hypothetical protein